MLRKFWASGPRWECILPESEERIEKFVDTAENEPRQNLRFLRCLWGSFSFSKIAFSKWHFFDAGRAESRPIYSSGVSEWVPKVSGRLVDLCQANQKKWFFHFFYSSLGIRLCKVSWRVLARAARHFGMRKLLVFAQISQALHQECVEGVAPFPEQFRSLKNSLIQLRTRSWKFGLFPYLKTCIFNRIHPISCISIGYFCH